jgi:mRNA export factor
MDAKNRLLVVGVAQKDIYVYDLQNPQREVKHYSSPLKYQSRCVSCFPNASGFALGSVEGRVAIQDIGKPSYVLFVRLIERGKVRVRVRV